MPLSNFVGRMMVLLVVTILPEMDCSLNETIRVTVGSHTDTYSFPWFCFVAIGGDVISGCTIVQKTWVVVSVDNLNQPRPGTSKYYYQDVQDLVIYAGMEPLRKVNRDFYQVRNAYRLYVGNVSKFDDPTVTGYVENPQSLSDFVFDAYGLALGAGLIKFLTPYTWSAHVLPAPLFDWRMREPQMAGQIRDFRERLEYRLLDQSPCVLASFQTSTKTLIMTEVIYIPDQACKEAYCIHDQASCTRFPKLRYLMCFKSLLFMDMCPTDRGMALYCESFNRRVVGFLTTAINCGAKNLPCVYTSIEFIHRLFRKITFRVMDPGPSRGDFTTRSP